MELWHKNKKAYSLLVKQINEHFPSLIVVLRGNKVFVIGEFYYRDMKTDIEVFRYSIEIEFPDDYPNSVPLVRETGGKIPRTMDRHYDMQRGGSCLFLDDEKYKFFKEKPDIVNFINTPVKNFFLSQAYFDLTGKWLFGDWSHGVFGIFEYYCEELDTKNTRIVINFLKLLSDHIMDPNHKCYCGSNKKLIHCHINKLVDMRNKIDIKTACVSYERIVLLNQTVLSSFNKNLNFHFDKNTGKPHIM